MKLALETEYQTIKTADSGFSSGSALFAIVNYSSQGLKYILHWKLLQVTPKCLQ